MGQMEPSPDADSPEGDTHGRMNGQGWDRVGGGVKKAPSTHCGSPVREGSGQLRGGGNI